MRDTLRRTSVRRLVAIWSVYWAGLAVIALGRFAVTAWRLSQTSGNRASINVNMADWVVSITAQLDGATVWSGSAAVSTIALWIVGPPLLTWLVWLSRRGASHSVPDADRPEQVAQLHEEPVGDAAQLLKRERVRLG